MTDWEASRDTIGNNRTWIIGRALAGVYFLLVGLWIMLLGLVIALVFAVIEAAYALVLNRPLNLGRAWAHAIFMSQLKVGKYVLGMRSYSGIIPRKADGMR